MFKIREESVSILVSAFRQSVWYVDLTYNVIRAGTWGKFLYYTLIQLLVLPHTHFTNVKK